MAICPLSPRRAWGHFSELLMGLFNLVIFNFTYDRGLLFPMEFYCKNSQIGYLKVCFLNKNITF